MIEPRCDDDEEVYPALTYAQSLKAWRLRNGRWLVHERRQPFGDDGELIRSFGFAARMPR